ncbi:MAG: hypothetical protein JXK50_07045 [Campylobacterales bacterium]|nr:hypothetical protein [Campylobacterales bacterium]
MKVALIVPNDFEDLNFLTTILDQINCEEIISGTSAGYKLLEKYLVSTHREITISKAQQGKTPPQRTYNAIDAADQVIVLTHDKGIKTKKAIEYAQKQNKPLTITICKL